MSLGVSGALRLQGLGCSRIGCATLFPVRPLVKLWSSPACLQPAARLHALPRVAFDAAAARDSLCCGSRSCGSSLSPQTRSCELPHRLQPLLQQPPAQATQQQQQQAVGVFALLCGGPSSNAVVRQQQRRLLASAPNSAENNATSSRSSTSSRGSPAQGGANVPRDHPKEAGASPDTVSSSSSRRSVRSSFAALMNSPQWIGMKRQQQRLQRLWLREFRKQQEQQSLMRSLGRWPGALQMHALGLLQRFREALTSANRKQLQQQVKRKRLMLQGQGTRLKEKQQAVVSRLRQELRLQQQQLRRQLQQQQSAMQEKRLIWAERRRRKLAAALLLMQQQRAHLTAATAGAKEKLRALWRRYGWTAVVSYAIVHALTLLSLFAVASAVPLATLKKMAAYLLLAAVAAAAPAAVVPFCPPYLCCCCCRLLLTSVAAAAAAAAAAVFPPCPPPYPDSHKVWGAALFAYLASKPLVPLQVALAIWLTPSLARLFGRRIDRLGGKAEAAASSAAGDAAAAAAAAAAKAATAAARSCQAAKVRRDSWKKNKNNSKGPPPAAPPSA
ncbi:hypothetical protein Emag_003649 [Eimeria magna]